MVSVSIVTYNTDLREMERCLASLRSPLVSDIFVIDNSRSESMACFCSRHPELTYIPNDNTGFGAGHNIALRKVIESGASRYHLVVNSDVSFDPGIIGNLVAYADSHPDTGLLHPGIVNPDGSPQYTARLLPTPLDSFGRRFLPKRLMYRRNDRYLMRGADRNHPFEAPYFQGSFLFLRVEALLASGIFDERFFMYPEDIDLSRRIGQHYRTVCLPYLKVVHDHRRESYRSIKMLRIHIVNMIRYFNKWGWWIDPERRKANRNAKQ